MSGKFGLVGPLKADLDFLLNRDENKGRIEEYDKDPEVSDLYWINI